MILLNNTISENNTKTLGSVQEGFRAALKVLILRVSSPFFSVSMVKRRNEMVTKV